MTEQVRNRHPFPTIRAEDFLDKSVFWKRKEDPHHYARDDFKTLQNQQLHAGIRGEGDLTLGVVLRPRQETLLPPSCRRIFSNGRRGFCPVFRQAAAILEEWQASGAEKRERQMRHSPALGIMGSPSLRGSPDGMPGQVRRVNTQVMRTCYTHRPDFFPTTW